MRSFQVATASSQLFALGYLHFAHGSPADLEIVDTMDRRDVPSPMASRTGSDTDNGCSFYRKQIPDPDDPNKLIWTAAYPDDYDPWAQCMNICGEERAKLAAEGKISSTTCWGRDDMNWQPVYGIGSGIDTGMEVGKGNCSCNEPLINSLAEGFMEALPAVGQLGCNILMSAINAVIDIGALAIPGVGQAIGGGMIAGIQAAKLAAYTYDAASNGASAFSSWASDGGLCVTDHLPENVAKAFDIMNSVTPAVLPKGSWSNGATPKWPKGSGYIRKPLA